MDYKTKAYYRDKIKEIAKRTKISELYITKKALELATSSNNTNIGAGFVSVEQPENEIEEQINQNNKEQNNKPIEQQKTSHIGYYLISDGIKELYKILQTNKKPKTAKNSVSLYILSIAVLSILLSGALSFYIYKQSNIIYTIITFIPATQISTEIIQYILNKIVKPSIMPKMDYINRNTN